MTTVYLVRHAEAEGNLYRIAQGQDNSNLTDRGWRQVKALERRFADVQIDAVYSSDLYRTCATASAVFLPKGLPLHKEKALREIHVGVWERRTWGDLERQWPQQLEDFREHLDRWHVEGAETGDQVLERMLQAVQTLAARHDGQTIALFSHGYAIRLLLSHLQGYTVAEMGKLPTGDNTAVSCLTWEEGRLRVVFQNDNSHLMTPEYLAGEKVKKRAFAVEAGLRYEPLRLPEQAELFPELTGGMVADTGDTLVAYRNEEPVGVLQMGTEHGCITALCVREDLRRRGYGVQLLGQAVYYWRPRGCNTLRIVLPEGNPHQVFFADYGFVSVETVADGGCVLEKQIGFDPAFL